MLSLPKRLAYRDRVLDQLGTLLVMYPRGRQFAADFPGLKAAIRAHFDDGTPPASVALVLAVRIITDLLGRLDQAGSRTVAARLRSLDLGQVELLVARQISRSPEKAAEQAEFSVRLVGGALLMAGRMVDEGSLDRRDHVFFLQALDKALRPEEVNARSFAELFGSPEKPSLWGQGAS